MVPSFLESSSRDVDDVDGDMSGDVTAEVSVELSGELLMPSFNELEESLMDWDFPPTLALFLVRGGGRAGTWGELAWALDDGGDDLDGEASWVGTCWDETIDGDRSSFIFDLNSSSNSQMNSNEFFNSRNSK